MSIVPEGVLGAAAPPQRVTQLQPGFEAPQPDAMVFSPAPPAVVLPADPAPPAADPVDPAVAWRQDAGHHQLAVDVLGLQHF